MAFQLNDQQLDAVKKCVKWYFCDSYKKRYFALMGWAGCGKSTVVNIIIKMLGLQLNDVIFCTLTGKASLVLRMKGNPSNTIHKIFYTTFKKGTSFMFSLKKRIPSNIQLIVIDEVSMVTEKMLQDILSFGVNVICLGDSGQLPPVGAPNFIIQDESKIDVQLTKVMRQDDSSGILDLATMVRNGISPEYGQYKMSRVCHLDEVLDKITSYDMVICYSNAMRRKLNYYIRKMLGYTSIYPQKGEKIICLMNNYNYNINYQDIPINIVNGMRGETLDSAKIVNEDNMELVKFEFVPDFLQDIIDPSLTFTVKCFAEIFEQYQKNIEKEAFIEELYNDQIDAEALEDVCIIDYGYAATCHKLQGSEYDNVLVVVEDKIPSHIYNRWLYTAITRGKQSVTVATVS